VTSMLFNLESRGFNRFEAYITNTIICLLKLQTFSVSAGGNLHVQKRKPSAVLSH